MSSQLPILVITLAGQDERRAPLLARLESHGLAYQMVFGVDGRKGLPPEFASQVDRGARHGLKGRTLTDPELAGAFSHLESYRRMLQDGHDRVIVLEDDAIIGGAFAAFARGEIDAPGDLVLFDHWKGSVRLPRRAPLTEKISAYPVVLAPSLATGYAITRRGAQYMLDHALPLRGPADWPCDITRLHTVMIHPRIVSHPETTQEHSDLETGRGRMRQEAKARQSRLERLLSRRHWAHEWGKLRSDRLPDEVRLEL